MVIGSAKFPVVIKTKFSVENHYFLAWDAIETAAGVFGPSCWTLKVSASELPSQDIRIIELHGVSPVRGPAGETTWLIFLPKIDTSLGPDQKAHNTSVKNLWQQILAEIKYDFITRLRLNLLGKDFMPTIRRFVAHINGLQHNAVCDPRPEPLSEDLLLTITQPPTIAQISDSQG